MSRFFISLSKALQVMTIAVGSGTVNEISIIGGGLIYYGVSLADLTEIISL
jgi:hypothetical protein